MNNKFLPDDGIPDVRPFRYADIIPDDGILYDAAFFEHAAPAY